MNIFRYLSRTFEWKSYFSMNFPLLKAEQRIGALAADEPQSGSKTTKMTASGRSFFSFTGLSVSVAVHLPEGNRHH